MTPVKIAVAIIKDKQQRILITQRPAHVPHGGSWEFPGGKLEPHESPEQALIREIKEELGLDIYECHLLNQIIHDYSDKSVHLFIFQVIEFSGNPECREGQLALKWVEKNSLNPDQFPEANREIFAILSKQ